MKIKFKTIEHKRHRYPTVGDYWTADDGTLQIRVTKMKDRRYSRLVFLHELIEATLVREADISFSDIDAFDVAYESARHDGEQYAPCGCAFVDDPGDDIHAPYHLQHTCASNCERLAAQTLDVEWEQYEQAINELFEEPK